MPPVRRQISPHASQLRRDQTDCEQRLWMAVRGRRLGGWKLRRQATIGPFVVDFLCVEAGLIVELDGGQHSVELDADRRRYLEARGLRVLRFWNTDVMHNIEGVLEVLLNKLESGTHRPPVS